MDILYSLAAIAAAYLIGSLSFAVIVSRAMGLDDPRSYGSKNAGATNVLRSGNKKAAIVTLVLDALKGFVAVFAVKYFGERFGWGDVTLGLAGLAVFVGHLWPVFFKFKGGKGVATALGVLAGIHPGLAAAALLVFAAAFYFSRYVSLASMTAAFFAPVLYLLGDRTFWYASKPVLLCIFVMAALLIGMHRANISRLLTGAEPKFGGGSDDNKPGKAKKKQKTAH
jgi:acyl phosphate:glycerol-3-phosphate acyltransferase